MRLLPILLLTACAHAYREPCEYDVHVRLTEEANAECHASRMVGHNGVRLNSVTTVAGCGRDKIISNGTRQNVGHENGHVIEKFCPQWAEGYFD